LPPGAWISMTVVVGLLCAFVVGYTAAGSSPAACAGLWAPVWWLCTRMLMLTAGLPTGVQGAIFIAILWYSVEAHGMRQEMARQNEVATEQMRRGQYDRRMAVYRALRQHLSRVLAQGRSELEWAIELLQRTAEADFLFDEDVRRLISEVYQNSVVLRSTLVQIELYPADSPERIRLANHSEKILRWMGQTQDGSAQVFQKYLRITE